MIPFERQAIIVGLPASLRPLVEGRFRNHVHIDSILLRQDGSFRLHPPPGHAAQMISEFADQAATYSQVLILVLPYAARQTSSEVTEIVQTLVDLQARLVEPRPGDNPWPSRSPRLDQPFLDNLFNAICLCIEEIYPKPPQSDGDLEISFEILRGLASHSKMGPNNHSHEDDVWKSRGKDLAPGGKDRILRTLLNTGILKRKKNDSAGGTGWVYWIADVQKARETFPDLDPYF